MANRLWEETKKGARPMSKNATTGFINIVGQCLDGSLSTCARCNRCYCVAINVQEAMDEKA
jgi:hypothetical protein